jgi:hypothetical protein
MPVLTRTASAVFDPLTAGGAPRGADMAEARLWGTEIEDIILRPSTPVFGTRAAAIAATIDPAVEVLSLMGHTTAVDGGGGDYRRLAANPGHAASFQSADGAWWQLIARDGRWSILQIGGAAAMNAPGVDITPFINNAQAVCLALGAREVLFPTASYYLLSQPAPFSYGVEIVGSGKSFTVFRRQFAPGSAFTPLFDWNGANERAGAIRGCSIVAWAGTLGIAIRLRASGPDLKPDFFKIDDVNITSGTGFTWSTGLLVDGSLSPEGAGVSKGVRNLFARDLFIFNCTSNAINANVIVNPEFHRLFTAGSAGGTNGNVTITGVTDPRTDQTASSSNVRIEGVIGGTVSWQNTELCYFEGTSSGQTATASAINGSAEGNLGTISNSSDSFKFDSQRTYDTSSVNGHTSHPNNLLECWGRAIIASGATLAVTFDKAFAGTPHVVNLTPASDVRVWVTALTATGFTLNQSGTGAITVYYRAIGPG